MTEKELIKYLLDDLKIFKKYEERFNSLILHEIMTSIDIYNNRYGYKDGQNNISILRKFFSDDERKFFINKLLIEFYNKRKLEYTRFNLPLLDENDANDLSFNYIVNKSDNYRSYFPELLSSILIQDFGKNFKELVCNKEIKKLACKAKMKKIKLNYLYDFFYEEEKNWNYVIQNTKSVIEEDIENKKPLRICGKEFNDKDYSGVLDRFQIIKFRDNCIFKNVDAEKLITNNSIQLEFERCKIIGSFEHIFCQSIFFENCEIESYTHKNIAETKEVVPSLLFMDCKIGTLDLEGLELQGLLFKNTNNMKDKYKHITLLRLERCEVKKSFRIDIENREEQDNYQRFKINRLDLSHTNFIPDKEEKTKAKVKIQFCDIDEAFFYNTSFYDLADFYRTKFIKSVKFERADFMNISVFSEAEFDCDVDFKYVKFFGKAIFRDTVIEKRNKLNLRDTIFDDEANFLDISAHNRKNEKGEFIGEPSDIKVANRETARVIKNFYDNTNNIIEANRFYKLEMIEREDELDWQKRPIEWFVFKAHRFASNHSQDWLLPFLLILIFGLVYSLCSYDIILNNSDVDSKKLVDNMHKYQNNLIKDVILGISIFMSVSSFFIAMFYSQLVYKYLFITFVFTSFYIGYTSDIQFILFSNSINPFSIMTSKDSLTVIGLLFKVLIAYLIYQLIISIRQNTRRK